MACRSFGADRLEAAATRAIEIGTLTYGSVRSSTPTSADRATTIEENAVLTHPTLDQLGLAQRDRQIPVFQVAG
jgi:hypothetical protein